MIVNEADWRVAAERSLRVDRNAWAVLLSAPGLVFENSASALPSLVGCDDALFYAALLACTATTPAGEAATAGSGAVVSAVTQALLGAIVAKNARAVEACLKHGADPALRVGFAFGRATTALHVAAETADAALAARLMKMSSVDVNARDDACNTPLHRAAERGDVKMCVQLVLRGADDALENSDGRTPLVLCSIFCGGRHAEMKLALQTAARGRGSAHTAARGAARPVLQPPAAATGGAAGSATGSTGGCAAQGAPTSLPSESSVEDTSA